MLRMRSASLKIQIGACTAPQKPEKFTFSKIMYEKFKLHYYSSPRMNGSGKNGRKHSSNNGGSSGKNLSKNQHNHLNKPQSMDAFFFGNTSTVSTQ